MYLLADGPARQVKAVKAVGVGGRRKVHRQQQQRGLSGEELLAVMQQESGERAR